jgi:preprotein translocase subunit SecB
MQTMDATDAKSAVAILTIRSNPAEVDAVYNFEVQVAAIVVADPGEENMKPIEYATTHAGSMLYPFAREAVANLTGRGRFGPVWLRPFNFLATPFEAVTDAEPGNPVSGP